MAPTKPLLRRLDRCDRMIQNESRDPNGGNVYYITMQITFLTRKFRNVECNLHCDIVHITIVWVSSPTLDGNGDFAIKAYGSVIEIMKRNEDLLLFLLELLSSDVQFLLDLLQLTARVPGRILQLLLEQTDAHLLLTEFLLLQPTHLSITTNTPL